ncbi:recombinase family protein [Sphingomonas aracearum]|uniref:Recombinase family protein n=1 Tax=Sphingomonas aracearum TaxID=2283317 RepID=A0A369VYU7_9SPHN|nr:recombinase family protein [Sphingomonas aracearum]
MGRDMDKKAIAVLRWSTLEQGNSDRSSEVRQDANISRMAALHGWPIVERHVDAGRSAFTGENLTKGKLGELTRRFHTGALDPASHVIVVEELDRLSRQSPGVMTAWLTPLLNLGLTIAIANTGQILTRSVMETDFGGFVTMMSSAFSNYEFSRKQRERGNASWNKRREAAASGKNLSRHRARGWLQWDAEKKDYIPIPDRVWLVKDMFRLRLARQGKAMIAKDFNEKAKTNPIYRPWSTSKTPPKAWTASAIARIVQDRAVTGYVQYHRNPRGAEKKVPIGDPIKVYPPVIDEETWARANDMRLTNQLKTQGRGRAVSNLLGPLAKCRSCGGTMQPLGSARTRINKDGSKSQHYFLYCNTAKMTKGVGCTNQRGWTYSKVEQPILDRLLSLAIDDQHFRADDDTTARLEGDVVRLQRMVTDKQASKKRLLVLIADGEDEEAHDAYAAADAALKRVKADLTKAQEALAEAKGAVTPGEHVVRVAEVREKMESDDVDERFEARSLVKAAFQDVIDRIVFDPKNGMVIVSLVQGLGAMHILADGSVGYLDLVRGGKDYGQDETVEGFLRRRDGRNLTTGVGG